MKHISFALAAAIALLPCAGARAAGIRVAPVVKVVPTAAGAGGVASAGASVHVTPLTNLSFKPSVLPTLPALGDAAARSRLTSTVEAQADSSRAAPTPDTSNRSGAAPVLFRPASSKSYGSGTVPNLFEVRESGRSRGKGAGVSVTQESVPKLESRKSRRKRNRKKKNKQPKFRYDPGQDAAFDGVPEQDRSKRSATEELRETARSFEDPGADELGTLAEVFDGALQRKGTPAVRTPAEAEAIAAKTGRKTAYLAGTKNLSGERLLKSLNEISGRGYRHHSYEDARHELFSNTDNFKKDGKRGVVAAYSGVFVPGRSGDGSRYGDRGDANGDGYSDRVGMNTEHLWPQSYFHGNGSMRSDLHHLMATFARPNSERSRYPFGEVPDDLVEYRNAAGAKLGGGVFEPPDAVKGRVARGLLYFYMRYSKYNLLPRKVVNRFWNSRIEVLMRWNREFPPDAFELRRNDLVEEYQGNRNPFVDDHAMVDRIGVDGFKIEVGRSNRRLAKAAEIDTGAVYEGSARSRSGVRKPSRKQKKKKRGHRKKKRKQDRRR